MARRDSDAEAQLSYASIFHGDDVWYVWCFLAMQYADPSSNVTCHGASNNDATLDPNQPQSYLPMFMPQLALGGNKAAGK